MLVADDTLAVSYGPEGLEVSNGVAVAAAGLDLIEVRLLGKLQVRRTDGSMVEPAAYRTSKTRTLLRILALQGGGPVSPEWLVDTIWPDVDPERGRTSLRTAASQVRRALGANCVVREMGGLLLRGVWVDVAMFECLVTDAQGCFARGELAKGVEVALQAAMLYAGDLFSEDIDDHWVIIERERLRRLHVGLLGQAAEAAMELGWRREALQLAGRSTELDPGDERSYRIIMRAHAALGETERALRAFERCKTALADELGADPSAETRAVHLQLLAAPAPQASPVWFGRRAELGLLRRRVAAALRSRSALAAVVSGPAGIGKSRLVEQAFSHWRIEPTVLRCLPGDEATPFRTVSRLLGDLTVEWTPTQVEAALERLLGSGDGLLVVEDVQLADAATVEAFRAVLSRTSQPLVVVMTWRDPDQAPQELPSAPVRGLQVRGRTLEIRLGALDEEEIRAGATEVLSGRPAPSLVADLAARSGGRPAALLPLLAQLAGSEELAVSPEGLVAVPRAIAATAEHGPHALLDHARAQLHGDALLVLDRVAVLGEPFSVAFVTDATGWDTVRARAALDALEDARVLQRDSARYSFHHRALRHLAYDWLRPSTRRRLHEEIAGSQHLSPASRIEHRVAAGEPWLAFEAALEAAALAVKTAGDDAARVLLLRASELLSLFEAEPMQRLRLSEQLGDCYRRLGRGADAGAAYSQALDLGRCHDPGAVARLERKRGYTALLLGDVDAALHHFTQGLQAADGDPAEQARLHVARGRTLAHESPPLASEEMRRAVEAADAAGDAATRVAARSWLAPLRDGLRRRFEPADALADESSAIARSSGDEALVAQALYAGCRVRSYVGEAAAARRPLEEAWARVRDLDGDALLLRADVGLHLALVYHELGLPQFHDLWREVWPAAARRQLTGGSSWIAVRILFERGRHEQALREARRCLDVESDVVAAQLLRMPMAQLLVETGDAEQGRPLLVSGIDLGMSCGATLVVPEAAARLAAVEAGVDPAAAEEYLRLAESAAGEQVFARERCAILLARAALAASAGHDEAAGELAAAAAVAADHARLRFQQAEALVASGRYLAAAGHEDAAASRLRWAATVYGDAGALDQVRRVSELVATLGLRPATTTNATAG